MEKANEEYKNKIKKNAVNEALLKKYKEIDPKANLESLKYKINSLRDDDVSTFSLTWEVLFRKLDPNQQLFSNKTIMEVLYQGALGRLNENFHQMFNVPNTRCSLTPFSYSDNPSTCFDSRTLQSRPEYLISPPRVKAAFGLQKNPNVNALQRLDSYT